MIIKILKNLRLKRNKKKERSLIPNRSMLQNRLITHEGKRRSAYQDIHGYWTIGIGRLIDSRLNGGLSDDEMIYLLNNNIASAEKELFQFSWYKKQNQVRQEVLIELVVSMGLGRLRGFVKMIDALKTMDFKKAGIELMDSKWRREDVSKTRSADIRYRLEKGMYK